MIVAGMAVVVLAALIVWQNITWEHRERQLKNELFAALHRTDVPSLAESYNEPEIRPPRYLDDDALVELERTGGNN